MKNILYIIAFIVPFFVPNLQVHVLDASFENLTSHNPVGRFTLLPLITNTEQAKYPMYALISSLFYRGRNMTFTGLGNVR